MDIRTPIEPTCTPLPPAVESRATLNANEAVPRLPPRAGNALRHGMTSSTLLPNLLGAANIAHHVDALTAEWKPATHTERLLIHDIARHAAALDLIERAEAATWRQAAHCLSEAAALAGADEENVADQILVGAVTSDGLERVTRYRRAHEKGFVSGLQRLRELQARRQRPPLAVQVLPFTSEADCERYLHARGNADWRCLHCGHRQAHWLERRAHWQCRQCRRQQGLRAGTVFAGSSLPILTWFRVIWAMLGRPMATTAALAEACGLERLETVRRMAGTIRAALGDASPTALLAGLERLYADEHTRWTQISSC
jgi:hypothetical protein